MLSVSKIEIFTLVGQPGNSTRVPLQSPRLLQDIFLGTAALQLAPSNSSKYVPDSMAMDRSRAAPEDILGTGSVSFKAIASQPTAPPPPLSAKYRKFLKLDLEVK